LAKANGNRYKKNLRGLKMAKANGNRYKKNLRGLKMAKANGNRCKKNVCGFKMAKFNCNRCKKIKSRQILHGTQNQHSMHVKMLIYYALCFEI
jgi:hypothetical protein